MSKIILTEEQNTLLEESVTTDTKLELYTPDLKKIGYFSNKRYQSRNKTNVSPKNFHRIFFKFSQPYKNKTK